MKVNIGPYKDQDEDGNDFERVEEIEIHDYDTWSADHTLALIIHPLLVQLRKTSHGCFYVFDEDVPPHLRSGVDQHEEDMTFTEGKWQWIMDELIWTFLQLKTDCHDDKFFTHTGEPSTSKPFGEIEVDTDGLEKHHNRIDNGLMMFGKYFRGLWD